MRLSTKVRYGVRLMIDLAAHQGEKLVFLKDVARRQQISPKYLWQVVNALKVAGLVVSERGVKGGYALSRQPAEINMLEVVEALDNSFAPVACLERAKSCKRSGACAAQDLWRELGGKISSFLGSVSLQEMLTRQMKKQSGGLAQMYYI